jgi:hypothetical protein
MGIVVFNFIIGQSILVVRNRALFQLWQVRVNSFPRTAVKRLGFTTVVILNSVPPLYLSTEAHVSLCCSPDVCIFLCPGLIICGTGNQWPSVLWVKNYF